MSHGGYRTSYLKQMYMWVTSDKIIMALEPRKYELIGTGGG